MKKILMASVILFLFAISVLILQTSCSKTEAQTSIDSITQLNKIIYYKRIGGIGNIKEIWTANYDGTNAIQVPVTLPAGLVWDIITDNACLTISPDGQTVFFTLTNNSGPSLVSNLYSCSITGANLTLIPAADPGKVHAY